MENIKLFISLAFRKEGKPEAHPEAIFNLEPIAMRNYLEALKKKLSLLLLEQKTVWSQKSNLESVPSRTR